MFDSENDYKKTHEQVSFGKNQKKSGDFLQNEIINFLLKNYPNSMIKKETKVYGSNKKSKRTGKIKPKLSKIDVVWDKIAISAKNQFTQGTAEQKLIYELCMIYDYLKKNKHTLERAYIIYNGDGMKIIKEEYPYIPIFVEMQEKYFNIIEIISFDDFKKRYTIET